MNSMPGLPPAGPAEPLTAPRSARACPITRVRGNEARDIEDAVAVEEPLEIRAVIAGIEHRVTVTMRTPGDDARLAIGLLFAEGVVEHAGDVLDIRPCASQPNLIRVDLAESCVPRLQRLTRNFVATSSCGLCGKTSLEAVFAHLPGECVAEQGATVDGEVLRYIPERLRAAQSVFEHTGGLHAVGAFSFRGDLIRVFEDVGRHNAFDKLVGAALLGGETNLRPCLIALSGRAGFELLQKAALARAPMIVAFGAPSTLAIELAQRAGITLIGFLRATGFNVYTHPQRLALTGARGAQAL